MSIAIGSDTWSTLANQIYASSNQIKEGWIYQNGSLTQIYPVGSLGCWWYMTRHDTQGYRDFHLCASKDHIPETDSLGYLVSEYGEVGDWSSVMDRPYYDHLLSIVSVTVEEKCIPNSCFALFDGVKSNAVWNNLNLIDMSSCSNLNNMFRNCTNLSDISFLKSWNTHNVTTSSLMFASCTSLTSADMSEWETTSIEDSSSMFYGCNKITNIDLSNWNTSKVTDMGSMFYNCKLVEHIYVGAGWNTDSVTASTRMFYNCSKLPNYSSSTVDKTMAYIGGYLESK